MDDHSKEGLEEKLCIVVAENIRLKEENRRLKALLKSFTLRSASSLLCFSKYEEKSASKKQWQPKQVIACKPSEVYRNPQRTSSDGQKNVSELGEAEIALFRSLFRGREDVYAVRWENRKGKSGYAPACANEWHPLLCKKQCSKCNSSKYLSLSDKAIIGHLMGVHIIGVYPLLQDETCWFLAVDFDKTGWQEDACAFLQACRDLDVKAALEKSRSGQGGHVWIFFEEAVSATIARKLGSALLTRTMDKRHQMGLDSYDRLFPNQDTMPKGGFGNLIALPLQGIPSKTGNSIFLKEDLTPYENQWEFLSSLKKTPVTQIERLVNDASRRGQVIGIRLSETDEYEIEDPWTLPPSNKQNEKPLQGPFPITVRVVFGNLLYIEKEGLSPQFQNRLIRMGAFQNPEFYRAQKMRLSTFGKPRVIGCAEDFTKHIALPRGCLDGLEKFFSSYGITLVLRDERYVGIASPFVFHGMLAPEQKSAASKMLRYDNGILVAPTGFGKTVLAAWLIAERGVNTIVVVHRKSLLDQWRERLASFLNISVAEIGTLSSDKKKLTGCIDVVLIQSLCRKGEVDNVIADYGHIIIDECHHIPAFTFEQVVRQAKAKYVLGLTATPVRKDGRHPIIIMQCGPIRIKLGHRDVKGQQCFHHLVIARDTEFIISGDTEKHSIQDIYGALAIDMQRNEVILEDVRKSLKRGCSPLLLTERKEHLEYLAAALQRDVQNVIVMRGGMGKKQRAAMEAQMQSISLEEPRVIIATGRYAGEGFDDARLDTLFLTMPISWRGTLQQYVGRLHRAHAGKHEVRVYDYVDRNMPVLMRMYAKRLKGYHTMGYVVHGDDAESCDRHKSIRGTQDSGMLF